MKLASFVTESTADSLDLSEFFTGLDQPVISEIKDLLVKFKGYKVETHDSTDTELFIHVSNGLVDFDFSFYKEDSGATDATVDLAAMVNDKYVYNAGEHLDTNVAGHKIALMNTLSREFSLSRPGRLNEYVAQILNAAHAFSEWYFDISATAGKVKLMKITTDLEDGSSNSVWKWTPYVGQFWVDGEHVTARTAQ